MIQSVMGTGLGASNKYTTKELAVLANSPSIVVAGSVELAEDLMVNPPTPTATVTFGTPLPGNSDNYVVLITGMNIQSLYVASVTNNDDGNFSAFRVLGDEEGTCMYLVAKAGIRPNI
jgi:hypothetical protein